MALIGGLQAVPGRVMGHDGAFAAPGEGDAQSKVRALVRAGVVMTNHPSKFGDTMKSLLSQGSESNSLVRSEIDTVCSLADSPEFVQSQPTPLRAHLSPTR